MVHGQTGNLGDHVGAIVENQGCEHAQIRHQEMEEDPVVGQDKNLISVVVVLVSKSISHLERKFYEMSSCTFFESGKKDHLISYPR